MISCECGTVVVDCIRVQDGLTFQTVPLLEEYPAAFCSEFQATKETRARLLKTIPQNKTSEVDTSNASEIEQIIVFLLSTAWV